MVGVDHIPGEAEGLQIAGVKGDGLVAGEAHGGGAVLAVGPGVGQGVNVQGSDDALFGRAQAHLHLHGVAGAGGDEALFPGVDHPGGAAGLPGDEGGVHFRHHRLLCAEAAADAGLFHMDFRLGDVQGVGQDAPHMEHDLGGGHHMQPPVGVQLGVGAEGLHHGLVAGLGVIGVLHHHIAVRQHLLHVAVGIRAGGAEVAAVVRPHGAEGLPALLRVHQHRAVQRFVNVQHRGQHLILHLDALQGLPGGLLGLGGHDGYRVAHKADVFIQNEPVIGGGLGPSLARHGEALLGHVLPGVNGHHPRRAQGGGGVDGLDEGVSVGAAQHLDHKAVRRGHVLGVDGLAQQEGHGVLFAHGRAHGAAFGFTHGPHPLCGCSKRRGCPAAAPRSRSSGRGCLPGRPGCRRR